MRLPRFTELSQGWQFFIGALIVFFGAFVLLVLLTGCSTFDAPIDEKPIWVPVNEPCAILTHGDVWVMGLPRNQCIGRREI